MISHSLYSILMIKSLLSYYLKVPRYSEFNKNILRAGRPLETSWFHFCVWNDRLFSISVQKATHLIAFTTNKSLVASPYMFWRRFAPLLLHVQFYPASRFFEKCNKQPFRPLYQNAQGLSYNMDTSEVTQNMRYTSYIIP